MDAITVGSRSAGSVARMLPVFASLLTLATVAVAPAPAAWAGGTIRLGVACDLSNAGKLEVPDAADAICVDALHVVERMTGEGGVVGRVDPNDETVAVPDYPVVLIAMELRPDWAGGRPRLLLRVALVRDGRAAASTGLPPAPIDLNHEHWAEQAHASLTRMIGFAMR